MGGSVSIVNNTTCALSMSLQIVVPYYYETMVLSGESMERSSVGHVWFDILAFPWHAGLNRDYFNIDTRPELFVNSDGECFTLLEGIGTRCGDWEMVGKSYDQVDWSGVSPLQNAVFRNGDSKTIDRYGSGYSDQYYYPHYYDTVYYFTTPFRLFTRGWYIGEKNIWEIQGGPHCQLRVESYLKNGVQLNKTIQVIDETQGLNGFTIVKVE